MDKETWNRLDATNFTDYSHSALVAALLGAGIWKEHTLRALSYDALLMRVNKYCHGRQIRTSVEINRFLDTLTGRTVKRYDFCGISRAELVERMHRAMPEYSRPLWEQASSIRLARAAKGYCENHATPDEAARFIEGLEGVVFDPSDESAVDFEGRRQDDLRRALSRTDAGLDLYCKSVGEHMRTHVLADWEEYRQAIALVLKRDYKDTEVHRAAQRHIGSLFPAEAQRWLARIRYLVR